MNNRPTGNHKHLTLSQRISIEHGLAEEKSVRAIAALTGKDPSTISKEIRKHAQVKEYSKSRRFAKIPCSHNRADSIERIFDSLTEALGIEVFRKLFEVILTDNGHEFQNPNALEISLTGEKRTAVYYCDPYRSNQKGVLEKNHEYIRYVRPKGTTFEDLDEEKVTLLMNHINSEKGIA